MTRILGVNGILTRGQLSTDRLLAELARRGHETIDVKIPVRGPFTSRFDFINRADARRLITVHQPGDAVVAHSRGALVIWFALELGARFSYVFLFSPAMESDRPWPAGAGRIVIVHNPDDPVLRVGALFLFHPFGALGLRGYEGPPDARIMNVPERYPGHSDYFLPGEVARWAGLIDRQLRD